MKTSHLRLAIFITAIWLGSFVAVGAWVVPTLFQMLETKAMAGKVAAQLFNYQSWLCFICSMSLAISLSNMPLNSAQHKLIRACLMVAVSASVTLYWFVAPEIVAKSNPALWHPLGSLLFVLQGLCAGALLWQLVNAAFAVSTSLPHTQAYKNEQ